MTAIEFILTEGYCAKVKTRISLLCYYVLPPNITDRGVANSETNVIKNVKTHSAFNLYSA